MTHFSVRIILCFQHPTHICLQLRNENFVFVRVSFCVSFSCARFSLLIVLFITHTSCGPDLLFYFPWHWHCNCLRGCCTFYFFVVLQETLALAEDWPWLLLGFALLNKYSFPLCPATFTRLDPSAQTKCLECVCHFLSWRRPVPEIFSLCQSQSKLNSEQVTIQRKEVRMLFL